jgi:hypothetical protein
VRAEQIIENYCACYRVSFDERKERVAIAGGQLLSAAFSFLGEMLPKPSDELSVLTQKSIWCNDAINF